jgi:hypothetical protein
MALIVELYKRGYFRANLLITCIDELFEEINNQNIEILCQMLQKITLHQIDINSKSRQYYQQPAHSQSRNQN